MHPVLFRIGNFPVAPYGILVAIGMLCAIFSTLRRTRRLGLDDERLIDLATVAILSGLLGAKALYLIVSWEHVRVDPWGEIFSRTGLVFYGGILGAAPAMLCFFRKHQLPMWRLMDAIAPGVPLAHFFGRVGCFTAGCCYGKVCSADNPFAVRFPLHDFEGASYAENMPPAMYDHYVHGLLPPGADHSLPVLPVQLLEAAMLLALFLALAWFWQRRKFDGQIFLLYLAAYGAIRIVMETMRGDAERGVALGFISTSTAISLGMIGCAVWFWIKCKNTPLAEKPIASAEKKEVQKNKQGKRAKRKRNKA